MRAAWLAALVLVMTCSLLASSGCSPDPGAPDSLISDVRILAVQALPAETPPGQATLLRALVATPTGTNDTLALDWAFCTSPKPPGENNVVNADCLANGAAGGAAPAGLPGPSLMAVLPADGCSRFGPQAPPMMPGIPAGRPRDPDATGGYYQPIRVALGPTFAIALARIECDLAGASFDVAADFRARYQANKNPTLGGPPTASLGGSPIALDRLPTGRKLQLTVQWTPDSVEIYPVFCAETGSLVDHRESMRVSWYATGGRFDDEHTGRGADDPDTTSENGWMPPAAPGIVRLWVVLRDARGGMDFMSRDVTVVETP